MARSMNLTILIGNVGRSETKFTPSGKSVTKFSVATSSSWKDKDSGEWKETTEWHNCVLWGHENLAPHIEKGKQISVRGQLQTRKWDKDGVAQYSTEVVADEIILLGSKGHSDAHEGGGKPAAKKAAAASGGADEDWDRLGIVDSDVPF